MDLDLSVKQFDRCNLKALRPSPLGPIQSRYPRRERLISPLAMVASPEICRLNGAKSKGPKTARGKAISSRNATKHGLLAQQPPLLITEDLSSFEGVVQGLVDHYSPESPVEHFLIQQVAMGMLKQNRLWNAEAASANLVMLRLQKRQQFPDHVIPASNNFLKNDFIDTTVPFEKHLGDERRLLLGLLNNCEYDLAQVPDQKATASIKAFDESLGLSYWHDDRSLPVYQYQDELDEWLKDLLRKSAAKRTAAMDEAVARMGKLVELARQRLGELNAQLEAVQQTDETIRQETMALDGIQQPELFSRYQQAINRDLYAALDRLDKLREQRQNKDSMGSFGPNAPRGPK